MQALIQATQTCQPRFDFTSISIVTDKKPVSLLLGFLRAETTAFEFGVTVVGNTALFTRMEEHTPRNFKQYRDAFKAQYTKISASAARTISHQRVVKYDFAGETILLRHAVDAYLADLARSSMPANGNESTDSGLLVKRHEDMNMNNKKLLPSQTIPRRSRITVAKGGCHIPHAATLEFTTRSAYSREPDSIERKIPGSWISQTPNLHLCIHTEQLDTSSPSTVFNLIRYVPMARLLNSWEDANAEKLRALASVLTQIRKAAEALGGSCIVSSDGGEGATLTVSRAERGKVPELPEDMQSLFYSIKKEAKDMVTEQTQVNMPTSTTYQNGTGKRKYGTTNTPERTTSPPLKKIALNSIHHHPTEDPILLKDGELTTGARTTIYDGTRKRKLDAEDALERTVSPPARRRALNARFCTYGKWDSPIKQEESGMMVKDEPPDS